MLSYRLGTANDIPRNSSRYTEYVIALLLKSEISVYGIFSTGILVNISPRQRSVWKCTPTT